jgi:hypothetical protein
MVKQKGTIMNKEFTYRNLMFRAWSTKKKEFLATGFHVIGETTLFDLLNQHKIEELDTLHIQQFTGCVDRYGKDIYEGDLVEHASGKICNGKVGEVIFATGCWMVLDDEGALDMAVFDNHDRLTVVGNIFETESEEKTVEQKMYRPYNVSFDCFAMPMPEEEAKRFVEERNKCKGGHWVLDKGDVK